MATPASEAETFSASPLKPMNGIQQNSQEARSQRLLLRLCFSGLSEEQDSRPGMWLAEAFSISPLKPLNGIQQNLTGRKISTPSNKFVFFGSIGGKRWPPSLWFAETFRLLLRDRWTRFNETCQEARSQRPLPICVIRADKKAALASDWLRHFRLLLCDRWTEFNETWQEAKFQRPLPSSCYSIDETWQEARYQCPIQSFLGGRWEKQDGCPGLWLTETFSTSPLNGIQQNLTENKICQRHLPSLCFSGRSEKHFTHVYDMWPLGLLFVY